MKSLLGRLLASGGTPGPLDDFWYGPVAGPVASGVTVNHEYAEGLTVVSGCVKVIAETTSTLPIVLYREIPAGKERAVEDPRSRLLRRRPNRWQNSLMFREMLTGHAALRGVGYAEMVGHTVDDLQLIPRHPNRVRVLTQDGAGFALNYAVRDVVTGTERTVPARQMFVLQGPWGGRSPVQVHREAIGLGLAMQEYAARFFGNGSHPGGVLKAPQGVTFSPEQRNATKESWERAHRGPPNAHRVAVLEGGLEWQQIGLSAEDSQLFQSRQMTVPEICRIWNVPPYKVQEYGRATWSNTEQMAIDFLTTCMLPWFRRWEEAIQWYLIGDDEPLFAEFLVEGLLRGDTLARYQAYQIAAGGKPWMTPNEIRALENRNQLPGLDDVAPIAQGAAPGPAPAPPPKPMREEPPSPDARAAQQASDVIWSAWADGIADSLARVEDVEMTKARGLAPAAAADYVQTWYRDKYAAIVGRCLNPMRGVWRGRLSFDASIEAILANGVAWATTNTGDPARRSANIRAILAEGSSQDVAA